MHLRTREGECQLLNKITPCMFKYPTHFNFLSEIAWARL